MTSIPLSKIAKEKFLAEHPDARVASGLPRLDVRAFQTELLKRQRQARADKGTRDKAANLALLKFRNRVRQPINTATTKPIDTSADRARGDIYFELPNGQALRAKRVLGLRHRKADLVSVHHNATRRRVFGRKANPVNVAIVRAALDVNANREKAAA